MSRIIEACSNPGDLVLDPFLGSGTTAAVALWLGRRALGIEINPEYAELARRTIDNVKASATATGSEGVG